MEWNNAGKIESMAFTCGFCGNVVASDRGYVAHDDYHPPQNRIHVCPHCTKPTYFNLDTQVPGVAPGAEVGNVPKDVSMLYREARNCVAASSYTASVLVCRKLLMSIAVAQGANPGDTFVRYVEYLASSGFVPPNGKGWVDHIRKKGNEANHEIALMTRSDERT
jgi:hypothetical protein